MTHVIPTASVLAFLLLLTARVAAADPAPATQPAGPNADAIKVLLVTGDDYPGHKWKETTPVLAAALRQDPRNGPSNGAPNGPRLAVTITEDPATLAAPALHQYRAIVLHWMNWQKPDPGPAARENLRRFVAGGGGLVLVHFACGAFQDWREFRNLAGRSYDPKLPPHDPYGPFRVTITDVKHPITAGLAAFDTTDELYTCLAGDRPIEILATAKSKVDGKDYPMAFVLPYERGRVFHCVLGHDVKALANPAVGELYRRGTAWAAGVEGGGQGK